jgi:hypothetical protein
MVVRADRAALRARLVGRLRRRPPENVAWVEVAGADALPDGQHHGRAVLVDIPRGLFLVGAIGGAGDAQFAKGRGVAAGLGDEVSRADFDGDRISWFPS